MACRYDGAFFIFFATIYRQQEQIETVGYREESRHDGREVYIVHAWLHLKAVGVPNSCKEGKNLDFSPEDGSNCAPSSP
jgi:hypothetical protein